MSAEAVLGAVTVGIGILVSVILWSADRHARSLDKMDQRLTAHLAAEEADMQAIGTAMTAMRGEMAATRVDVAFIAGRQGIDLPPRS